jgi:hypothetical protein
MLPASTPREAAPPNKASDLNADVSWVLQRSLKDLPDKIRSASEELRLAISTGQITSLSLWYINNCKESKNVADELKTLFHIGRRPSPGIGPPAFAHGDRHNTAQPAGQRSSRERTPSTARTRSGRHTLRSPGGNLAASPREQFKSTPPFFARKPAELLAFLLTPPQLTGQH